MGLCCSLKSTGTIGLNLGGNVFHLGYVGGNSATRGRQHVCGTKLGDNVKRSVFGAFVAFGLFVPQTLWAEIELSLYGGVQSALPSQVDVSGDSIIPDASFRQQWDGNPFEWPVYVGVRITEWRSPEFGIGLDYTHNKIVPPGRVMPAGYRALELTDGLNTWTLNMYRKWPDAWGRYSPYVGGGFGLSVPGVEVRYGASNTFEYQVTGIAVVWLAGVSTKLGGKWSGFAEYKGSYTENEIRLTTGGWLSTDVVTNAINVGISYGF